MIATELASPSHILDVARVAAARPGAGVPLAPRVRAQVEPLFGFDFAAVRVHPGSQDAEAVGARAFASGRHIWLAPGYSQANSGLLVHELSHVVQQATGEASSLSRAALGDPRRAALEGRAREAARHLQSSSGALAAGPRRPLPTTHEADEVIQFDFESDALAELHRMAPDDAAGLAARRERLRQLFSSLGPEDAGPVLGRLRTRRRGDRLSERFHDMLATETRHQLLGILEARASVTPERSPPETGTTSRNTWPFPGFAPEEAARYIDDLTTGVAVNLMRGVVILEVEGRDAPLILPVAWFSATDREVVPILPVLRSREAAAAEVERAAVYRERRGWTPITFYRDESGLVLPIAFNNQTAPRIMTVYAQAFETARRDVTATRDAFVELLFWYIGARGIGPRVRAAPTRSVGRLIVARGRVLSPDELAIAGRLVREGRTVRALAESTREGVRTADFVVDGIRTELKTIRNLTSGDLSGALGRRILEGAGQAPHIIADVRGQAGMTRDLALRAIRRAFGADALRRIQQIRIIGRDFDVVIPRLPI